MTWYLPRKKKWYLQMDTLKLYTGWRSCFWENMRLLWLTWMHKLGSLLHTCSVRVCQCAKRHILFGGLGPLLVMEILWFDLPIWMIFGKDYNELSIELHDCTLWLLANWHTLMFSEDEVLKSRFCKNDLLKFLIMTYLRPTFFRERERAF